MPERYSSNTRLQPHRRITNTEHETQKFIGSICKRSACEILTWSKIQTQWHWLHNNKRADGRWVFCFGTWKCKGSSGMFENRHPKEKSENSKVCIWLRYEIQQKEGYCCPQGKHYEVGWWIIFEKLWRGMYTKIMFIATKSGRLWNKNQQIDSSNCLFLAFDFRTDLIFYQ